MEHHTRMRDATNLIASPPLKRLEANLHDLIIACWEAYTRTPGSSLALTKLHYVSDEKHEGKFSMHFDALVKDLDQNENTPASLTFTVKMGDFECYPHS